ncbi:MAG: hypothetical protein K6D91_01960 [Prevotella sp.]|nr:hypothetical protein [Prevotella sp.]
MKHYQKEQMCNKMHQIFKGRRLSFLMAVLLSAIMWMSPSSTWAADPNDDVVIVDGVSYHVLRNENDWNYFRMLVEESMAEYDVNAIMDADFNVTSSVGIPDNKPFRGIFNDNGHTLNVAINGNDYYMAPLRL